MKRNDIFRLLTIVLIMAFAIRLAIGFTANEIRNEKESRYNEAIETLQNNGVLFIHENGSAIYAMPWECEKETIQALNEISNRHELTIHTH